MKQVYFRFAVFRQNSTPIYANKIPAKFYIFEIRPAAAGPPFYHCTSFLADNSVGGEKL